MLTSKMPIWLIHIVVWIPLQPHHKGRTQAQKNFLKKCWQAHKSMLKLRQFKRERLEHKGKGKRWIKWVEWLVI